MTYLSLNNLFVFIFTYRQINIVYMSYRIWIISTASISTWFTVLRTQRALLHMRLYVVLLSNFASSLWPIFHQEIFTALLFRACNASGSNSFWMSKWTSKQTDKRASVTFILSFRPFRLNHTYHFAREHVLLPFFSFCYSLKSWSKSEKYK